MTTREEREGSGSRSEALNLRSIAIGTTAGSFIEWYDFFVYGIAAAFVFGQLFFPNASVLAGTMLSFATFATGWLARPIGGLVFGVLGDRIGRRKTLLITVIGMGLGTTLIGVLPTYHTAGVLAPVCLVLIRLLQGIFAGGEWSGAAALAVESAPPDKRGLYSSFPQLGNSFALLASQGISLLLYAMPHEHLLSYGWRVPFLASIVVIPIGYYFQHKVREPEVFTRARQSRERAPAKAPLAEVFRTSKKPMLIVFLAMGGMNVAFYTFSTFGLSFATGKAGFSQTTVLVAVLLAAVLDSCLTVAFGALSDKVGRRPMYITGMVLFSVGFFPFFALVKTGSTPLLILAYVVCFGAVRPFAWSVAASLCTEMFPTSTRYTGSALGYQVAGTIFGAPLPIIGTALVAATGDIWAFCGFAAAVTVIAAIAVIFARETAKDALMEDAEPPPARVDLDRWASG